MIKPALSHAVMPLAAGALTATLLLSGYAMIHYVIPAGGDPYWDVEPQDFVKVFPWILMFASAIFFLAGPVIYVLLRKLGLFTWWGATVAGGVAALVLASSFSPFSILVHPFYFLIGSCSGLLSFHIHMQAVHRRAVSTNKSGGTSRQTGQS